MKTGIRICTLGRLTIERDGEMAEKFVSTKAMLLFVYLAMHPGEHNRRRLASMLWSETTDEQALKNLRTVLSNLRQQMDDVLFVSHESLAIDPDAVVTVDALEFETGSLHMLSGGSGAPGALKAMQALADLYKGGFLAGTVVRDAADLDEWILEKGQQLESLYMRLLLEIVETAHRQAAYDTGLNVARRLVSLDPLWDVAQRQLMRALTYNNRASEALQQYDRFVTLLHDELDASPDDETTALAEQIRSRAIAPPQSPARSAIVLPDMPFIEPVEDIQIAQRMLNTPQCRLLTAFGISGIGKTALITQLAFQRQELYGDGTFMVSINRDQTARDLPGLIAHALGIEPAGQADHTVLEALVLERLRASHLLLVLDNFEVILPETGFIQRILDESARVQVLVGSQSPLNMFREWLLPLKGLSVPSADDAAPASYEAVRLFELTAQRINPRFSLMDNLASVVRICQLVDGLPLAIVIAAGWTQVVPLQKIIDNIMEGQEFNLPLQQALPAHHQSLEMMLEYTWNTLSPAEQHALTALSIFNFTSDLDEILHICGVELATLAALIQRSLIQKYDDKYRMHQLVWRYTRRKLLYSDQKETLERAYLAYYTRRLAQLYEAQLQPHDIFVSMDALYGNIWHFDWMSRAFQPVYMLSMSRFLMSYWEVAQVEASSAIRRQFELIPQADLPRELGFLLNVQLARLYLLHGYRDSASACLTKIMREHQTDTEWRDLSLFFLICAQVMAPKTLDDDLADSTGIIWLSNIRLARLLLDTRDDDAARVVLGSLLALVESSVQRAGLLAAVAAVAADHADWDGALEGLSAALAELSGVPDSPLALPLQLALMRVTAHLGQQDAFCRHLSSALRLCAALNLPAPLLHVLDFWARTLIDWHEHDLAILVQETADALHAQVASAQWGNLPALGDIVRHVASLSPDCFPLADSRA
ncbi:MAG: hypothetical protein KME04_07190 [Pleurocapsa minor GSE-CHR-MK-17-07R]|jgi:DNA-binding SARP family transcriptional activator|nr:hypothetical protein [Pleurocapsa minor GSE-CHR-MK 17-07R]